MKRIVAIGAVVAAFAVAPASAFAGGGNFTAQIKPQVSAQVIRTQVARVQIAHVQRAQAAFLAQRHQLQIARAGRITLLRSTIR